jgi:hypothetical protein
MDHPRQANLVLLLMVLLCSNLLSAQNQPGTRLKIKKAQGQITLDGVLDEPDWQAADVAGDWYLNYPVDTILAPFQTEARLTFNDEFLYLSFVCHDDDSPDIINSLRRDFNYELNDNVGVSIGSYNDRLNGFFFVVTPKGVQMEGTVTGGGNNDGSYNIFWDNKWYSKTIRYEDKWIVEIALPFKSFRFKSGIEEWNIAFDRWHLKHNQKSSWIRTPIQYATASFAYGGQLRWEDPIPPAKTNISFIPYLAGSTSRNSEVEPVSTNSDLEVGFDAKIGITPSMNLDLTVNPDFSQVEVDRQVINLTRFEFRFPERRQFFLENSDLYDQAGFPNARPFFSRRIGLVRDTSGLFQRVPIAYGARLSGSLNENWRMGVMNMHTREQLSLGLPAQNYTVAALQRNFWAQSSLAVSFVNKQSLGVSLADTAKYFHNSIFSEIQTNGQRQIRPNTYNRVISADLELLSKDNKWYHSSFLARSFDEFDSGEHWAGAAFMRYAVRNLNLVAGYTFVNEFFNAEAGFVPSAGVYPGQYTFFSDAGYRFYPEQEGIVSMGPSLNVEHTYIPGGTLTDKSYSLSYGFRFLNTSSLEVAYNYIFQQLTNSFNLIDPERYTSFEAGEEYDWNSFAIEYQSNTRQKFNVRLESVIGGFYNGRNFNLTGELNYRYQPLGNISLRLDFNDLNLPDNYGKEQLFLIGPRIDLTLTDKIFLTTYYQYNNLLDNMNLNARFQWRFQPASDLFIVYTENYLPLDFSSKNRALVFKMTYWMNL